MHQILYTVIAAVALLLIFEGLFPFIAPDLWRRTVRRMAERSDKTLHTVGFLCLFAGTVILFVNHLYFY